MRTVARLGWCVVHTIWSLGVLLYFCVRRRGALLVFTHYPDVDQDGLDRQMGPLIDRLLLERIPFVEITFVALNRDFIENVRLKRRAFLSYVLIAGPAWVAALFSADKRAARRAVGSRVAGILLRMLRPKRVVVTDESGSGQTLLRAARRLGIAVIGVQHGDFQEHNAQYTPRDGRPFDVQAADLLCVWSPWFRDRLTRISPVYDVSRVVVTGRLRYPTPARSKPERARLRVLVLSEAADDFPDRIRDYLTALEEEPGFTVSIQPHPAEDASRWSGVKVHRGSLVAALLACDVALGIGSSALLEALYHQRPGITLVTEDRRDPSRYGAEGLVEICSDPPLLAPLCRSLTQPAYREWLANNRARVWGDNAPRAVGAILDLCVSR